LFSSSLFLIFYHRSLLYPGQATKKASTFSSFDAFFMP
jgi:hypothetical protein